MHGDTVCFCHLTVNLQWRPWCLLLYPVSLPSSDLAGNAVIDLSQSLCECLQVSLDLALLRLVVSKLLQNFFAFVAQVIDACVGQAW